MLSSIVRNSEVDGMSEDGILAGNDDTEEEAVSSKQELERIAREQIERIARERHERIARERHERIARERHERELELELELERERLERLERLGRRPRSIQEHLRIQEQHELLEQLRKQEIMEREREFLAVALEKEKKREKETKKVEQSYQDLEQLINEVDADEATKEKIKQEFKEIREAYDAKIEGELQRQQDQFDFEWELRKAQEKTDRIIRLLDRDLVAVIIGGILLLILGIALIVLIYNDKVEPTLLESAFFVILGFFFGQGVSRVRRTVPNQ